MREIILWNDDDIIVIDDTEPFSVSAEKINYIINSEDTYYFKGDDGRVAVAALLTFKIDVFAPEDVTHALMRKGRRSWRPSWKPWGNE